MKTFVAAALIGTGGLAAAPTAIAADSPTTYVAPPQAGAVQAGPRDGVKIGYLDCTIAGGVGYVLGSAKSVDCAFRSSIDSAPVDVYSGTIRKLGVDLGFTTDQRLIWAVFAPTAGYHDGSLSGIYEGLTAEATLGAGVGANVLVGGTSGSIHLQTVSVTGQLGLNLAATGTSMTLNAVN